MVFKLEIWPRLWQVFVLIHERSCLEAVHTEAGSEQCPAPCPVGGRPAGPPPGHGRSVGGGGAQSRPFAGRSGPEVSRRFPVAWSVGRVLLGD